jgi:hypothetical protein
VRKFPLKTDMRLKAHVQLMRGEWTWIERLNSAHALVELANIRLSYCNIITKVRAKPSPTQLIVWNLIKFE